MCKLKSLTVKELFIFFKLCLESKNETFRAMQEDFTKRTFSTIFTLKSLIDKCPPLEEMLKEEDVFQEITVLSSLRRSES